METKKIVIPVQLECTVELSSNCDVIVIAKTKVMNILNGSRINGVSMVVKHIEDSNILMSGLDTACALTEDEKALMRNDKKIAAIRSVMGRLHLGLVEAKHLVEAAKL